MTSQDVERRLTEVLHDRAEAAMSRTDTHDQLQELLARTGREPTRARRPLTVAVAAGAAAAAVAAVAAAVFWGTGLTDDGTAPPPVQQPGPDPVRVAEDFVTAYTSGDAVAAAGYLAPDTVAWPGWTRHLERDQAWHTEFFLEPCRAGNTNSVGTEVLCDFALHTARSEELGRGPFEDAVFSVFVDSEGRVLNANPTWNYETNGLGEHIDSVYTWVADRYPQDMALLELDELEVPEAEWDRWLALWEQRQQDYVEANGQR